MALLDSSKPMRIFKPSTRLLAGLCAVLILTSSWRVSRRQAALLKQMSSMDLRSSLMQEEPPEQLMAMTKPMYKDATLINRGQQHAINFRLEPERFASEMGSCMHDPECRIYYFHFQKTGGQDVEARLHSIFPPNLWGCCFGRKMTRFRAETEKHCLAKFSGYEVTGPQFLDKIVSTCMNTYGGRAILLATFREPIQRTVSQIHQTCNKNPHWRNNETLDACSRCSYEQDKDFWKNAFIQKGVDEYKELQDVANSKIENTRVLAIDTADLSPMYGRLSAHFNHSALVVKKKKKNGEVTETCNFKITSEVIRGLGMAHEVYRNLTRGVSG